MKSLNTSILLAALLSLTFSLTACTDDELTNSNAHAEGDVIQFGATARDSRAYYGTGEGKDNWTIYWNLDGSDAVRIFSDQTKQKNYDYRLAQSYTPTWNDKGPTGEGTYKFEGTGTTGILEAVKDDGALTWNTGIGETGLHHFYAVYPGSKDKAYNVEAVKFTELKAAESGESYNAETVLFKCPFQTEQTVTVESTATEKTTSDAEGNSTTTKVYASKPEMKQQYMFSALDGNRTSQDKNEVLGFQLRPVMTTVDVVITATSNYNVTVTGIDFEAPILKSMADGAFYWLKYSNGQTEELADKDGNSKTKKYGELIYDASGSLLGTNPDWKDETKTQTFKVKVKGGNSTTDSGDGVKLAQGESVTLTLFLPPLDYSNLKFTVQGEGLGTRNSGTISTTISASSKKKTAIKL